MRVHSMFMDAGTLLCPLPMYDCAPKQSITLVRAVFDPCKYLNLLLLKGGEKSKKRRLSSGTVSTRPHFRKHYFLRKKTAKPENEVSLGPPRRRRLCSLRYRWEEKRTLPSAAVLKLIFCGSISFFLFQARTTATSTTTPLTAAATSWSPASTTSRTRGRSARSRARWVLHFFKSF